MKAPWFILNLLVVLVLSLPNLVKAEVTQYQILSSNLICINSSLGPKLFSDGSSGEPTEIAFNIASAFYLNEIKKVTKQLNALKPKIKKSPKDKKLKAKKKKLESDKKYISLLHNEILACSALAPIITQTPNYSNAIPPSNYYLYSGALIYSSDNQYLGIFSTNQYSTDSIANQYGTYGSPYQYKSVFNKFGPYGSQFQSNSAWNSFSVNPPILYINGQGVAYLTTNTLKTPRIDPAEFLIAVGRVN